MPWIALAGAAISAAGTASAGPAGSAPPPFYGGEASQGAGMWTVATGKARASATGSPSGAMAEWLTPALIVAGIVLVVAVWRRR